VSFALVTRHNSIRVLCSLLLTVKTLELGSVMDSDTATGISKKTRTLFVGRFFAEHTGIEVRWQHDSHFYVQGDYGVFFAGPFLQQSGRPHNLNYASMWTGFKF